MIIVLIYFGVMRSHLVLGLTMQVVLVALLIWTAPTGGTKTNSQQIHPCLGSLGSNNKIDFAVEDLKKRQHLIHRLPVVGLIEQPI